MNFLIRLSLGLAILIQGSGRRGRRAKDWRSSSRIVEPCLFWMAWSRSKIRRVHKKDGCASLSSRRFFGSLLPSIWGFALLARGRQSLILQITKAAQLCVATWNNYPAMPARNCSGPWALMGMRQNCEVPVPKWLTAKKLEVRGFEPLALVLLALHWLSSRKRERESKGRVFHLQLPSHYPMNSDLPAPPGLNPSIE